MSAVQTWLQLNTNLRLRSRPLHDQHGALARNSLLRKLEAAVQRLIFQLATITQREADQWVQMAMFRLGAIIQEWLRLAVI
jgi:hypothetical protein